MSSENELAVLLKENATEIEKLKQKLANVLIPNVCDDVWLLRYILSNKTAEDCEEFCKFAINWLKENEKELEDLRAGKKHPLEATFSQFQVAGDHKTTARGEPMFYVRIGLCNTKGLMDAVPYEDVLKFMIVSRVKTMDLCDKLTKQEGRLIKAYSVLDFSGFSIARGNDSRFTKIIGETSKLSEKLFPQLLGQTIFINVPRFLYWTVNIVKPLLSKRAQEKMVFCPGKASNKSISECPFVSKFIKLEDVPSFLGGKCVCPGGCIGGVPNSQTSPINEIDANGMAQITVSARSVQVLELPVSKDAKLNYSLKVEDRKIELSIQFKDLEWGKEVDVIQKRYLNFEDGTLTGEWTAPMDGMITFKFDNTHSLMRSKNVMYKFDIQ